MTSQVRVPSLWDVETVTEFPPVRDMTIAVVSPQEVHEFCRRYHYTDTAGSMMWRWGLWTGPTLLGIVAYNLPVASLCESVFGAEHKDHVWTMGRLALPDAAPHNSESRLIGGSLRAIQNEYQHVWAVVTYAATSVGHIGYVYQATNALYTGLGAVGKPYHIDQDGARRNNYLDGKTVDGDARGWTRHMDEPKHRYIYLLGNGRQRRARMALLRYPVLPYPKRCETRADR